MVNNNPGNIRLIKKIDGSFPAPFNGEVRPGAIKAGSRFGMRKFKTVDDGLAALYKVLNHEYLGRGLNTIAKIFPVYAPEKDANDPVRYISFVAGATGFDKNKLLNQSDLISLVKAITREEKGETLPAGSAERVFNQLKTNNYFSSHSLPYNAPAERATVNHFSWWHDRKKRTEVLTVAGVVLVGGYLIYNGKIKKSSRRKTYISIGR